MSSNVQQMARSRWSRRAVAWTISGAAALAAVSYGYDFGLRLSGPLVAVVTAANAGLMGWLLAGAIVDRAMSLVEHR